MPDNNATIDEQKAAAELLAKAVAAAQAVTEKAQQVAESLTLVTKTNDERVSKLLTDALKDAFGEHASSGRFVDVTRIPLLCKSVLDTNERLKGIEDRLDNKFVTNDIFNPVKSIVYGMVGAILLAVIGALLYMVIASPGKTVLVPSQSITSPIVK